jgi:hypothetical protein
MRPYPPKINQEALDSIVTGALTRHGQGVTASVWIGGADGEAWYSRDADAWHGGASSVKTAYLIELFAAHEGHLDEPLPGTAEIVGVSDHPAVVHFDAQTQADIRRDIIGASVRRVGDMMIRGADVSNAVYNAAANVTTAHLGGPESLTQKIHARAPEFDGIAIRRHMLADRNVTGDNEVTAATLARVLQRIASGDVPGVSAETTEAMRDILHVGRRFRLGKEFFKSGSLNTDPIVRVRSGYFVKRGRVIVYAVMTEQPDPGGLARDEAAQRLHETTVAMTDRLLHDVGRRVHGVHGFLPW